jgi:hypothetical protein
MPQACWQAASDGTYWLDIAIGNLELTMLIDLGMIDPQQQLGFSVEAPVYNQLKRNGLFTHYNTSLRLDASGNISKRESGLAAAQLICPITRNRLGPTVDLFVSEGPANVPHRVGLVFFHALAGCRVQWDLSKREWCIEFP